ncbi:MAG: hypothetical protein D6725_11680 [Planctomycetota bacterium]|nr:MAG: hypothetical protein D6725_11680 [Planctomycetota bacterium]
MPAFPKLRLRGPWCSIGLAAVLSWQPIWAQDVPQTPLPAPAAIQPNPLEPPTPATSSDLRAAGAEPRAAETGPRAEEEARKQPGAVGEPAGGPLTPDAGEATGVLHVRRRRTRVEIIEKFARTIELEQRIKRVDGFDPTILTVTALSPNQIRVLAEAQGVTTLAITDESGKTYHVEVFVKGDARHLQAIIDNRFPTASVEALKIQDSIVLRGWVDQPEHINQIVEIAEQLYPNVINQMRVGGVQQVLLKVKVMEVQRSKIRRMGFNFLYANRNGFATSTPGQLVQVGDISSPFKPGVPGVTFATSSLSNAAMAFGVIGDSNIFNGFFDALKDESLLKILAEPEMVTTNGRPSTMLSGGEFPILVPQSLGTVSIEWRQFGVRLEAVPMILGNGRLRLQLQPEVSERDFSNSIEVGGITVPALTVRRVNTEVEMQFGQTLMIAGLISSRQTAESSKIPLFGEIPWLGAAFRKVRHDDVETELVILVTPELVAPMDRDQVPQGGPGLYTDSPTDRELYFDGMLEVPSYGGPCATCNFSGAANGFCPHGAAYEYDQAAAGDRSGARETVRLLTPEPLQSSPGIRLAAPLPKPHADRRVVPAEAGEELGSPFDAVEPTGATERSVPSAGRPRPRLLNRDPGSRTGSAPSARPGLIGIPE